MTVQHMLATCGLDLTDRFTPKRFYQGNNDGKVRTESGRVIADTGGHEALTELIATALNEYMERHAEALPVDDTPTRAEIDKRLDALVRVAKEFTKAVRNGARPPKGWPR